MDRESQLSIFLSLRGLYELLEGLFMKKQGDTMVYIKTFRDLKVPRSEGSEISPLLGPPLASLGALFVKKIG